MLFDLLFSTLCLWDSLVPLCDSVVHLSLQDAFHCTNTSQFIYPSGEWMWRSVQLGSIVNKAGVRHIFWWTFLCERCRDSPERQSLHFLWTYVLRSGIAESSDACMFNFSVGKHFTKIIVSVYTVTNYVWGFQFFNILVNTWYWQSFKF